MFSGHYFITSFRAKQYCNELFPPLSSPCALLPPGGAISKWEAARGYPSIDSLREISKYFSLSLDELLSSEETLTLAQEDGRQREQRLRDLVFGLLDCAMAMFFFLPLFGQRVNGVIQEVSLLGLTEYAAYVKLPYLVSVFALSALGVLTLALQNCSAPFWTGCKRKLSLGLSALSALFFTMSMQPYAAAFTFLFLIIKALMLIKWA